MKKLLFILLCFPIIGFGQSFFHFFNSNKITVDKIDVISTDFNSTPFNLRYSRINTGSEKVFSGFYVGFGILIGKSPTSSGIYEVENGEPIMYDNDEVFGSFGSKLEESNSITFINAGFTRNLSKHVSLSMGLRYKRNLSTEKRNHFYSSGAAWGYEWMENRDKSFHEVYGETDIQFIIFKPFLIKIGLVFEDFIKYSIGFGLAF